MFKSESFCLLLCRRESTLPIFHEGDINCKRTNHRCLNQIPCPPVLTVQSAYPILKVTGTWGHHIELHKLCTHNPGDTIHNVACVNGTAWSCTYIVAALLTSPLFNLAFLLYSSILLVL